MGIYPNNLECHENIGPGFWPGSARPDSLRHTAKTTSVFCVMLYSLSAPKEDQRDSNLRCSMKGKRESGFGLLLELLIAMAITTTLLAGSTAFVYRVRAGQDQAEAQTRLHQIAQAEAAIAICAQTSGCTPIIGLTAIIPADGSVIHQSGYEFTFNWNHGYWTYTAVPTVQGFSGTGTFYIDYSGVCRCMPDNNPSAGPTSPSC